jgi:nitronate monooxygenase
MPLRTPFTARFELTCPVIQAPLAGGGDTPELVAAVCEAGALGFIGAAYLSPAQIIEAGKAVSARTRRRFGINLFAPLPAPAMPPHPEPARARVAAFFAELGLAPPSLPSSAGPSFDEQLAAALRTDASVFSFTFGTLPANIIQAVKSRGRS